MGWGEGLLCLGSRAGTVGSYRTRCATTSATTSATNSASTSAATSATKFVRMRQAARTPPPPAQEGLVRCGGFGPRLLGQGGSTGVDLPDALFWSGRPTPCRSPKAKCPLRCLLWCSGVGCPGEARDPRIPGTPCQMSSQRLWPPCQRYPPSQVATGGQGLWLDFRKASRVGY